MKHSIRKQFAGLFLAMMAGTVALCWILNTTFLEKYYTNEKQKNLLDAYEVLNAAIMDKEADPEKFSIIMQNVGNRYNIEAMVVDVSTQTIETFGTDPEQFQMQLWRNLFSEERKPGEYLVETEQYKMKNVWDNRTHTEHLELWGNLANGDMFLLRTALEGIRDSARIANRFLAYVGVLSAMASGLIIWQVSRKVTEPIMELVKISERVAGLDFDVRYSGSASNEISILGDNINHMSEELEKTISELKTANNELRKDIQKKKEIEDMRTEFLSNVSHELKTPIALIQGYAEGLQEEINEDQESREFYCSVIIEEAAKMNAMVKKLLVLNQLESGEETITMERFDIVSLIKSYLQSTEILLRQRGISVRLEQMPPIFVWGDEFKVEEVFANYFTNAVNHAENEKQIEISFTSAGNQVRINVFNTGKPIPEESIPRIWDKFYKVDKARTREYGGSGIGLSIVKATQESMNQDYGVKNYENGVMFWFELERA